MTSDYKKTTIQSIVSFIEDRAAVRLDAKGIPRDATVSFADLFGGDKSKVVRFAGTKGQLAHKIVDRMADESINGQRDNGNWFDELRRRISAEIERSPA